tara:strand:+ start:1417 stop:3129 length:1713 start_codon:yes stop_codon:yes gene_type:complete
MIIFRKIKWKNLLSTGNYFTEIKLDNKDSSLIVGENGSGKSTLLDALCFVLFNKPFRKISKPQIVNSINGKDCVVEIEFDTNNKSYKVIRGAKPNIFEIYQNKELVNQDAAAKDYQDFLEKFILKLNYKSFTQIVMLGSASFTPFMQLSPNDRRAIIEDLLDIRVFSTMNGLLKNKMLENKDNVVDKKHSIELDNQKHEIKLAYLNTLKEDNRLKIEKYKNEKQNCEFDVVNYTSIIGADTKAVNALQSFVADKTKTEARMKTITKLESKLESHITKSGDDIQFFQEHDDCPTCKQAIDLEFKNKTLDNLSDGLVKYKDGLKELETKFLVEQKKLNVIQEHQKEIANLQIMIATNNNLINSKRDRMTEIESEIENIKSSKSSSKKEELDLKTLENSLTQKKDELKSLLDDKVYYEVASTLLKDTGIKTKIIKQYLPIINQLTNKYLSSLDFFVNFNLDESFKETIKSRHRDDFSYSSFSEGEKQRIDMALLLTWRAVAKIKNSANTNLLILDETFDSSLDANGTEDLMKILQLLEDVNLFVISHKGDVLQDKFMNVIKFRKDRNFSRIVN